MHVSKKDIFSIPNLLGYFRIIMVPVFAWLYLQAETPEEYRFAAVILGLVSMTDLFDGWIARKFHMVTELGKLIDPVADKLTHGVVLLCLASRYRQIWLLVGLFLVKEGFMAVMGLIKLRKGKKLDGAMWFGKVCTAVLFIVLVILLAFPFMPEVLVNVMVGVTAVLMIVTLCLYIPVFRRM